MAFAFLFFDSVGGGEWLVLLAVVLIVVGPRNLPAAARKMGQILSQLRRAADEFKRQIMTMDQEMEKEAARMQQSMLEHDEREGQVLEYLDTLLPEGWYPRVRTFPNRR